MPNPFSNTHEDQQCYQCRLYIPIGEMIYVWDEELFCDSCALDADIVCECGNKKKQEFATCWDCKNAVVELPEEFALRNKGNVMDVPPF